MIHDSLTIFSKNFNSRLAYVIKCMNVNGLRKVGFRTHSILFTFKQQLYTLAKSSDRQLRIDAESYPARLLLQWLVFEACKTSIHAQVVFKLMAPFPLDEQTACCNSPNNRLISLPWIQLFCVICGGKNGTNGCHLTVISVDIAFARHFMAPCMEKYKIWLQILTMVTYDHMGICSMKLSPRVQNLSRNYCKSPLISTCARPGIGGT